MAVGVIWYVTYSVTKPELTSTWLIWVPDPGDHPVILPELGVHVQEKLAPATPESSVIFVLVELHICDEGGLLATLGIGFTVATKLVTGPSQLLAWGVIWYVTVSIVKPLLVSV